MAEIVKQDKVKRGNINKHEGIINFFDSYNAYPQVSERLILHSSTATRCAKVKARFLYGQGMTESGDFWKMIVNSKGLRVDQFLRILVDTYCRPHNAFAFHINYNAEAKPRTVTPLPFANVRVGKPDDEDYSGKIVVYPKWEEGGARRTGKDKGDIYDVYNPDPEVIKAQIRLAGGLDNYKGQVFYYGENGTLDYPAMAFESVRKELEIEKNIAITKNNNVTTNFLASHLIEIPCKWSDLTTDPDDPDGKKERDEFIGNLKVLSGQDGAAKFMVVNNTLRDNDGNPIEIKIKKFDLQNYDKLYEHTETTCEHNIIKASGVPHILVIPTTTGFSTEILNSYYQLYNEEIRMERQMFEEVFMQIFQNWYKPVTADFRIKPLSLTIDQ